MTRIPVLVGLLLAISVALAPGAAAVPCGSGLNMYRTVIDPVAERQYDYDDSGGSCTVTTTLISCDVTPVVEAGDPHWHGYRSGVYVYQCDTSEGVHTDNSAEADFGPPTCQHVPYVAVGGEQVPGTDETYCTLSSLSASQPIDTPAFIPATGVLVVHSTGGYNWVDAMYWAPDCIFTHDVSGVPVGYADTAGVRIEYMTC